MAASALVALANAVVVFVVPGTGTTVDVATGNVMPVEETLEVSCFLKVMDVVARPFVGVEVGETLLEGYVVEPRALDARVVVGTQGTVVFAGEEARACEVVEARVAYGATGLLGGVLQGALGDRVRLYARGQV